MNTRDSCASSAVSFGTFFADAAWSGDAGTRRAAINMNFIISHQGQKNCCDMCRENGAQRTKDNRLGIYICGAFIYFAISRDWYIC